MTEEGKADGSITVFLTLVFLLIISLIGTCIQMASVHNLERYMDGYGDTALEAVFSNYQKELWQDYGLFLLKEGSLDAGGIAEETENYLQADLTDNKGILLTEVKEEEIIRLSDYPDKILSNQIMGLMKYEEIDDMYKKFIGQAETIGESAESAKEAAEEMKKNKAASDGQAVILELMQMIDGIVIRNGNVKYDIFGQMKHNSHCAKNLISLAEDKQSMGVLEESIWQAIKSNGCSLRENCKAIEDALRVLFPENGKEPKKAAAGKAKKKLKKAVKSIVKGASISLEATEQALSKLAQWKPEGDADAVRQKQNLSLALEKNRNILARLLQWQADASTRQGLLDFQQQYEKDKEAVQQYGFSGTAFSYEYVLAEKSKKNPLELLKVFLHNGVLDLVIEDASEISGKKTATGKQQEKEEKETDFSEGLLKSRIEETDDSVISQLDSAGKELSVWKDAGNDFMEQFMLTEYIFKYFGSYVEKREKAGALDYEMEYLLYGQAEDKENLGTLVSKIAGIRTLLAFAALLSDKEKKAQVELTAIALLGFTGIPALVKAAQYLILLCWAYEEALIDTAALLKGEKLSFIKSSWELLLSYEELFSFGRDLIQKKVRQISKGNNKNALSFSYQDYIRLFLMMEKKEKLYGRMMYMIQENMRLRYDAAYSLEDSIFYAGVRVSYRIPATFIKLPFVSRLLGSRADAFKREKVYGHAY